MKKNTLILNRFNGQEQFFIDSAVIMIWKENGKVYLNFEITTDIAIKTLSDTKNLNGSPNAEFTVVLGAFNWNDFVGCSYYIPFGYDEKLEKELNRFYYFEHRDIDSVSIVVKMKDKKYLIEIEGLTEDINYGDGTKEKTKVIIKAWFSKFKKENN